MPITKRDTAINDSKEYNSKEIPHEQTKYERGKCDETIAISSYEVT